MAATATGQSGTARLRVRALLVIAALVGLSLAAPPPTASAQISGLGVSVTPAFSSPVAVRAQNQAALISITNNSFGTAATEPVRITNIRVNASCDAASPDGLLCPAPEARRFPGPILTVDATAAGRAGTACAGVLFTVSPPDAAGTVVFVPNSPVTLGPAATGGPNTMCIVDFAFDVLQRPLDGVVPARAVADASTSQFPGPAPSAGVTNVTVLEAPATVAVQVTPPTITEGATFTGTATVTGVAGGPQLSGTVTFRLFRQDVGPSDCTGPPDVTSSPVPLTPGPPGPGGAPTGTASSPPFSGQPTGRYAVVATYDENGSDPNYLSANTYATTLRRRCWSS